MPFVLAKTGRDFLADRSKLSPRFPVIQNIVAQTGAAVLNAIRSKRHNTLDFASKVVCQRGCYAPPLESPAQPQKA